MAKTTKKKTAKVRKRRTPRVGRIEDDTPILPYVVADSVVEEVERFLGKRLDRREVAVDALADRADVVYRANERFRKQVRGRGNSGRDQLYAFMRHWLSSWMLRNDRPTYESIPSFRRAEFANGLPLSS